MAGIAIGMLQSEAATLASQHSWLPQTGFSELIPLIVILVALLVTGRGIPARGGILRQHLGRAPRPRSLLVPTVAGTAIGVLALVLTEGSSRSAVIGTFIGAILALSLVVVTGYAGQVSLAQLTLAGVGGFALSGIAQSWGVPFPFAPLLAALIACLVGVVVGLPALRVRGLTLGIVTLALAYAIEAIWFRNGQFVGVGRRIDRQADAVRSRPRRRHRRGVPAHRVRAAVPVHARRDRLGRRAAPHELARFGDARRAGQRAVGGRDRRERRRS